MSTHLVTGAGSGIGAVLATELLGRGDAVILVARNAERAEELRAEHPGATTLVLDLADPAGVEQALADADLPDRLDSLIHLAGVVDLAVVGEFDLTNWQRQLDVNLDLARGAHPRAAAGAARGAGAGRLRQLRRRVDRPPDLVGVRRVEVRAEGARRRPARARRASPGSG